MKRNASNDYSCVIIEAPSHFILFLNFRVLNSIIKTYLLFFSAAIQNMIQNLKENKIQIDMI